MAKSLENQSGSVPNTSESRPLGRVLLDSTAEGILNTILFTFRFVLWSVQWTFATVFFVAIMGATAYFVFTEAVKGGETIVVPEVVGLPITKASLILAEAGLEIGRQNTVASDRFPEYHVMLQRPAAQKVVRSGRKVALTVSAGKEYEDAPNLVGKPLEMALQDLEATRLMAGAIARMPHEAVRGAVLAQDPGPNRRVQAGGEIHLLVSDGPRSKSLFMPQLVGKPIWYALELLAATSVETTTYSVDRPGEDYEVVLVQRPVAGSVLREDQIVSLDVRLLPTSTIPNVRRKVKVTYTVPTTSLSPEIRVDVVDANGIRKSIYPRTADYVDGAPPRLRPGTTITVPVSFKDSVTVEFYADGFLNMSYYYEGHDEPVVEDHTLDFGDQSIPFRDEGIPPVTVFQSNSVRIGPAPNNNPFQ